MAKPSRSGQWSKKVGSLSTGSLLVIGLVVAGAAYSLAGDQIKDSANSLLAAARTQSATVTAPMTAETWLQGSTHEIKWTGTGTKPVTVWLLNSGKSTGTTKLASGITKGVFAWQVPTSVLPDTYTIRVSCVDCYGKGKSTFDDAPPITIASVGAPAVAVAVGGSASVVHQGDMPGQVDQAEFILPFTVTAGNAPIWIGKATKLAVYTELVGQGVVYAKTSQSTRDATTVPVALVTANGEFSQDTSSAFYVPANTSRAFDLYATVSALPGVSSAFVQLELRGINYSMTSTMGNLYYRSESLEQSRTDVVQLSGI